MDGTMVVNVEVIVERDNRYLLVVRSAEEEYGAGWLTFPGGKLDADVAHQQAIERTAQRELKEEVGLDVTLDHLRYVESHVFLIDDLRVLDIVMMTRDAEGEPSAVDPREVESVIWLTADEVMTHPHVPEWTRASLTLAIT